jgi:putative PIN family toxin of toxin-antitoxin system
MRCVLDTNVVLSALLWNGSPRQLWVAAQQGAIELFTSEALIAELRDVLSRPKCSKRLLKTGLSAVYLLNLYSNAASLVNPTAVPRLAPDPDDDVVIGTALAAKANFVVTGDRTLLSVAEYEGVRIITVSEALEAFAQSASHERR